MDILSKHAEFLRVAACGRQADSDKRSGPQWSLSKAGRDEVKKVFVSHKHTQDLVGRDSPGLCYEPKRQNEMPKWSFGTAPQRPPAKTNKYNETQNDGIPDSQEFKYHNRSAIIGSLRRGAPSNAPDLCGYVKGAISPGPQRYDPPLPSTAPSFTIKGRTKILEHESQTGKKVGPGSYPAAEACGAQASSEKTSLPQWGINKRDRFPHIRVSDSGRLWDPQKDQKERNCRSFSSAPSFSFGRSTRDHQKKVARCETTLDKGPAGQMDKMSVSTPALPARHEVMKYSQVPAG